jgi:hypothetical protein
MVELSLDQNEEVDAVEAFKTCHTRSKRGLSDPAREALVSPKTACLLASCYLILMAFHLVVSIIFKHLVIDPYL